jgi:hypothetical protein
VVDDEQLLGQCLYCRQEITDRGAKKHLSACPQRKAAIDMAEHDEKTDTETLYHLRVQDAYQKEYWLDLEMRGSSSLGDLDDYVRAIWLECCDHLSEFLEGGRRGQEISMDLKAEEIFERGTKLTHIYDFGTSSETLIKVVGMREGKPTTSRPIVLMARNVTPTAECIECGKPAAWLCFECMFDEDKTGMLCDKHAKNHPHENYDGPVELVNSPRLGMCGYTGPAEPPY